jgi:hypothetical protein
MNRRRFLQTGPVLLAGAAATAARPARPLKSAWQTPRVPARETAELAPRFGDGRDWWFQKRFGMFVQ